MSSVSETGEERAKRRGRGRGIMLPGLRNARENAGISLEQLEELTAEKGGKRVYKSTISELENLHRGAQGRNAQALAAALDTSVRALRTGEEDPA